jgi:hypothetical protein
MIRANHNTRTATKADAQRTPHATVARETLQSTKLVRAHMETTCILHGAFSFQT